MVEVVEMYRCVYCLTSTEKTDGPIPDDAMTAHLECTKKLEDAVQSDPEWFGTVAATIEEPLDTPVGQRELWMALFGEDARGVSQEREKRLS